MKLDNLTPLLQQGFRITLGATASLVETLQNPQKRIEDLSQLKSELDQLTAEWAIKGEMTEQEARALVERFLQQIGQPTAPQASSTTAPNTTETAPPQVQLELQQLTAQIAAIRAELEKLHRPDDV